MPSDDLIRRRLDAQLLSRPTATTPEEVVGHLLAVQAQDPRGMRLAVRVRSTGVTAADVDRALDDGRLVVSWLNRGTLHLVRAEDYWELFALTTPQLRTGSQRRLRQEGVAPDQLEVGVEALTEAVRHGPRTRGELRAILDEAGVPTAGQALVHVLMAASLRGLLVRGPMRGKEQAFVSAEAWLGPAPRLDRSEALTRLARRYLAGHGPADAADLAKWANLPLGPVRQALAALKTSDDPPIERPSDGLLDVAGRGQAPPPPSPRLLGPFDPLLLGWVDRGPFVGPHRTLVTTNGIFRPFALLDGRAVATWGLRGGRVGIDYLEDVPDEVRRELEADAAAVRAFLGLS